MTTELMLYNYLYLVNPKLLIDVVILVFLLDYCSITYTASSSTSPDPFELSTGMSLLFTSSYAPKGPIFLFQLKESKKNQGGGFDHSPFIVLDLVLKRNIKNLRGGGFFSWCDFSREGGGSLPHNSCYPFEDLQEPKL